MWKPFIWSNAVPIDFRVMQVFVVYIDHNKRCLMKSRSDKNTPLFPILSIFIIRLSSHSNRFDAVFLNGIPCASDDRENFELMQIRFMNLGCLFAQVGIFIHDSSMYVYHILNCVCQNHTFAAKGKWLHEAGVCIWFALSMLRWWIFILAHRRLAKNHIDHVQGCSLHFNHLSLQALDRQSFYLNDVIYFENSSRISHPIKWWCARPQIFKKYLNCSVGSEKNEFSAFENWNFYLFDPFSNCH